MKKRSVDVAILGAGTAGLTARRTAEKAGASTLVIDPGPLGTTCARIGCMPSKLLIAAADAVHQIEESERFGVEASARVDGRRVMRRVREKRDGFVDGVLRTLEEIREKDAFLDGAGRFVEPNVLEVDAHTRVQAKAVVVATGAETFVPGPYRGLGEPVITAESFFDLDDLPESVLVVGTGAIGMELGQALQRLKVRTTVLGVGDNLLSVSDPAIKRKALSIFGSHLDLHTNHTLEDVRPEGPGVEIRFVDSGGKRRRERFERVLVAAGIRPRVSRLHMEGAGVSYDGTWQPAVNPDTLQILDRPIFVAGDANGVRPLLHEAAAEGAIAGANAAAYPSLESASRFVRLAIVFTDPQVAFVGTPFSELDPRLHCIGQVDFASQGRATVMGMNRGLLRVYGDRKSRRLVGAEMIVPHAEHLAQLLAWVIQAGTTLPEVLTMPFYHPVLEEGLRTALKNLYRGLDRFETSGQDACDEFGPGT